MAAIELYPLIPKIERPELRPIIFEKIIRWRKTHKGESSPEAQSVREKIAQYSALVRREMRKQT